MNETGEGYPKVIAVDFDGVIHPYKGWKGEETFEDASPDTLGPMRNELFVLRELHNWKVIIWTARENIAGVSQWLEKYDIPHDSINENRWCPPNLKEARKISADIYIDDKAMRFEGEWIGLAKEVQRKYKAEWWRDPDEKRPEPVEDTNDVHPIDEEKDEAMWKALHPKKEKFEITMTDIFLRASELHKQKSSRDNYNGNEVRFGEVMDALYPNGLTIKGREDWIKYGIFHMVVSKALRLSNTIFKPETEESAEKRIDNAMDSVVYSAMLAKEFEK